MYIQKLAGVNLAFDESGLWIWPFPRVSSGVLEKWTLWIWYFSGIFPLSLAAILMHSEWTYIHEVRSTQTAVVRCASCFLVPPTCEYLFLHVSVFVPETQQVHKPAAVSVFSWSIPRTRMICDWFSVFSQVYSSLLLARSSLNRSQHNVAELFTWNTLFTLNTEHPCEEVTQGDLVPARVFQSPPQAVSACLPCISRTGFN